jgi:pimeloyl-ACP methyl ester carboxylesterase
MPEKYIGNAGNPLHRLPVFEALLSRLQSTQIIAVAPRSYWKSSPRRPSEQGILSDYRHALNYTISRWPNSAVILYGHSLGGSAAVRLTSVLKSEDYPSVKGLILENPFASIPQMVTALYPQRWLPYHYLTPFVWDKWDAVAAMKGTPADSLLARLSQDMLVLLSEKDEVVPNSMGSELFDLVGGEGSRRKVTIQDALHEDAWQQRQWMMEMNKFTTRIDYPPKS